MRKKTIMILILIIFAVVWGFITQRYAYSKDEDDLKKCAKDSDCSLSNTCIGCNQCFSKSPLEDGIDCSMWCLPDQDSICKCSNGYCTKVKKYVPEKDQIWVSKSFSGGRQCEDESTSAQLGQLLDLPKSTPPTLSEIEELLSKNKIIIIDKRKKHLPVCLACGCPQYSFSLCFLISDKDLEAAKKLGFEANSICERM